MFEKITERPKITKARKCISKYVVQYAQSTRSSIRNKLGPTSQHLSRREKVIAKDTRKI